MTSPGAATPGFSLAGAPYPGPQSNNHVNDGTACVGKPTDMGIVSSGPATTAPAGSTVTWNLDVANNGPANSSGFLVNDVTKGQIGGLTTTTPGCAVTLKGTEVQCAEGTLDNGDRFSSRCPGPCLKLPVCAWPTRPPSSATGPTISPATTSRPW